MYGRISAIMLPTTGAAIWPPLMYIPDLFDGVSRNTSSAMRGLSAGAKPMKETMYSFCPVCASRLTFSLVPVFPPMR